MSTNRCNENKYNNNVLFILLLLVLLKGNKTMQKGEDLLNGVQEDKKSNENTNTKKTTNDPEIDPSHFKNERIKTNIEKAKIKMLIKELKDNANFKDPIEEVKEVTIEPLKEVKELTIEPLEEKKSEQKDEEKLKELDKEEAENLEKEKNQQLSLEQPNKEEIGQLNEETPKELDNEVFKEINKDNLVTSPKESIGETKNNVKDFARNYIKPMEIILKQLIGENIALSTGISNKGFVSNAILLSVKDGIVNLDISHGILSIPIGEVVGVESNLIHSIELMPLIDINEEEIYDYKEYSLGNLFSTMIGEQIYIETSGLGSFNNIDDKTVTNLGQGIVVLDNTMAISLSKIILVERR